MSDINICLIEPEIPQNTGNVARTCAVTGAALHLVRPLGFGIDDAKMRRAGLDYWDKLDITFYDGIDEFLSATQGEKRFFFTKREQCVIPMPTAPDGCFSFSARSLSDFRKILSLHTVMRLPEFR